MTEQPTTTVFAQVLAELAESKGIEGLYGLAERLRAAGCNETADSLPDAPQGGYGEDLLKVMDLSLGEMRRISDAWASTFLRVDPEAQRSKIFEHIIVDLDYVACLEEEEHGGTIHSKRIREVLIPFCEREGGLKSDEKKGGMTADN
jgi:hypothetical protein